MLFLQLETMSMKKIKVAINGFGRIGRITYRALLSKPSIDVIAINDLTDNYTLAHLLKYDSIHGQFNGNVHTEKDYLIVNNQKIKIFAEKDPSKLPWKELDIDVVIESTGRYVSEEGANLHLIAGAKKVIISAPAKGGNVKSIVIGVNEKILDGSEKIISNASCTTNSAAPMIKILEDNWGIEKAYVTTIHSYTGDQNIHDAPHKDLRRARAAAVSIIPTTTGAAKAVADVFPHLKGKLGGAGIRVPVSNGSLTDLTCILKKAATVVDINNAFKEASKNSLKGVLEYTEDPIVSVDVINNTHSCVFDSQLTSVLGNMVKVVGWYDNEMGYSYRLAELVEMVS